jgi:hypothetical protein
VPVPPTPLCCHHDDGTCAGTTVSDADALLGFPCGIAPFGTDTIVVGVCGADGRCVAGS